MNQEPSTPPDDQTNGMFRRINSTDTWNISAGNKNGATSSPEKSNRIRAEVEPDCEICGDTLWVLAQTENDVETGTAVPCACQADVFDQRSRLRTYAELGSLGRFNFGSLRKNHRGVQDVASFLEAKELAKEFAANPKGWLVFQGASGSGKTHFTVAIVNDLIRRGTPAKYVSALDIPDLIRSGWTRGSEDTETDGFSPLMEAPVLVIDDFGVQPAVEWVDTKIDQLMTFRFNSRAPTVVGLAKPLNELPERNATKLGDPSLVRLIMLSRIASDRAGISEATLASKTFTTFNPKGAVSATAEQRQWLELAVQVAKDFVYNQQGSNPWLYLQGDTGVGKTHIATAIAGASIDEGIEVSYWSLPRFLDRLRQTFSARNEGDFFTVFDGARDAELLILDDFGLQLLTDWSLEKLYQLIAYRHDRQLRTVVAGHYEIWDPSGKKESTNVTPHISPSEHWSRIISSDRSSNEKMRFLLDHQWRSIVSRLSDQHTVTVLTLPVPDYRDRGA